QMKFPIDPSLELRLKKNWSNKDSVFAILSEIEFVRTSLIEENMNQPGKKNTLLLQFSNLIETGIAFYQFAKTKPSKAQRMQWDDLKLNFENFYSAMKVYENESEKIKTILAAPRIAYDDTTAKTPVTVTEKNGVMLIEGGAPIEDEGGKQKLPTDTEIKLTYEKLLGYRKILLN
ncbi:MAG: hypothetical protein IAF38_14915, partial [Bacteroidia bacterium]|nr:hypothetical protein [Bacteroidia bacterium]